MVKDEPVPDSVCPCGHVSCPAQDRSLLGEMELALGRVDVALDVVVVEVRLLFLAGAVGMLADEITGGGGLGDLNEGVASK